MKKRDLLSLRDLSREEVNDLLSLARKLKRGSTGGNAGLLAGRTMALVFEKPSLRTRVSFETGILHLGGHAIFLGPDEINLGVRESPMDCARVLSRWVDLIVVRTFSQETLKESRAKDASAGRGVTKLCQDEQGSLSGASIYSGTF